jgi:guanyl-specific ribonuclease Sa
MRRPASILLGLVLLGLWAWSQHGWHAPAPGVGSTQASRSATTGAPPPAHPATGTLPRNGSDQRARADYPAWLPAEARDTLQLIARRGPYPHRQDGATFQNRERRLPGRSRGYYREYTVATPRSRDRGARRLIAGGDPPVEFFYTDDHYRSFRRFVAAGAPR